MEGILEGGHFSPPTPKLRVEGGRTKEQSVYNYFYLLFLESSSTWQQGGDNTSGEKHLTRPVRAEVGKDGDSLVWKARKQAGTGCHSRSLAEPIHSSHNPDPPSSGLTVPQFLPLDGMRNSSTRHSQEMNSEHLPRALYGHKIPLAVGQITRAPE